MYTPKVAKDYREAIVKGRATYFYCHEMAWFY